MKRVRSLIRKHLLGLPDPLRVALAGFGPGRSVVLEPTGSALATRLDWTTWTMGGGSGTRAGELLGFGLEPDGYRSHWRSVPALAALASTTTQQVECDIRDVTGLAACKSPLAPYGTLDAFAEERCANLIEPSTPEALARLLAWSEIRILRGGDHLRAFAYEPDALFLCNAGGGHHFAAARYVAGRLGAPVPLSGRLERVELNDAAVEALRREFEIFLLDPGAGEQTAAVCEVTLTDGLRAIGATYYLRSLPPPLSQCRAVFLPRDDARSLRAARAFRESGVTDLGAHLQRLVEKQRLAPALPWRPAQDADSGIRMGV